MAPRHTQPSNLITAVWFDGGFAACCRARGVVVQPAGSEGQSERQESRKSGNQVWLHQISSVSAYCSAERSDSSRQFTKFRCLFILKKIYHSSESFQRFRLKETHLKATFKIKTGRESLKLMKTFKVGRGEMNQIVALVIWIVYLDMKWTAWLSPDPVGLNQWE